MIDADTYEIDPGYLLMLPEGDYHAVLCEHLSLALTELEEGAPRRYHGALLAALEPLMESWYRELAGPVDIDRRKAIAQLLDERETLARKLRGSHYQLSSQHEVGSSRRNQSSVADARQWFVMCCGAEVWGCDPEHAHVFRDMAECEAQLMLRSENKSNTHTIIEEFVELWEGRGIGEARMYAWRELESYRRLRDAILSGIAENDGREENAKGDLPDVEFDFTVP